MFIEFSMDSRNRTQRLRGRVFRMASMMLSKNSETGILYFMKLSKIERSGETRDFSKFSNDTKIIKLEEENFFVAQWEIYNRNEAYLKF